MKQTITDIFNLMKDLGSYGLEVLFKTISETGVYDLIVGTPLQILKSIYNEPTWFNLYITGATVSVFLLYTLICISNVSSFIRKAIAVTFLCTYVLFGHYYGMGFFFSGGFVVNFDFFYPNLSSEFLMLIGIFFSFLSTLISPFVFIGFSFIAILSFNFGGVVDAWDKAITTAKTFHSESLFKSLDSAYFWGNHRRLKDGALCSVENVDEMFKFNCLTPERYKIDRLVKRYRFVSGVKYKAGAVESTKPLRFGFYRLDH